MNPRLILAASLLAAIPAALAQQPAAAAAPEGPPSVHEGMGPHAMPARFDMDHDFGAGEMHGPRGFGMRGDWWKNPELASRLGITPEQTKRLDDLSLNGKLEEIRLRAQLEEDEVSLEPLMSGAGFDAHKAEA